MKKTLAKRISSLALVSIGAEDALAMARKADRPRVILIRGLPGSGKSTLAKEFVTNGYRHIEADMYFYVHGLYIFRRTLLPDAHKWCLSAAKLAIDQGNHIVVSNVFSRLSEMAPYLGLSDSYAIVELDVLHENSHCVSPSSVSALRRKWEPLR